MGDLSTETPAWLHIESSHCGKTSLQALISSALPLKLDAYRYNPIVHHSLRIWIQCRKRFGLQSMSSRAPISCNHMFPPSLLDSAFKIWSDKGISSFKDLYIDKVFASFTQLTQKHDIPRTHFFRYMQIRDFVRNRCPQFPNMPEKTTLDEFLDVNVYRRGAIGVLYDMLSTLHSPSLTIIKSHWEDDLSVEFSDEQWQSILRNVHSSSICARHGLLQFKVLHRLHFSKEKLAKIYPGTDPLCNRCKTMTGSLVHTFWTCPNLYNYWTSIFDTLSVIFGIKIDPSPTIAIFGVTPEDMPTPIKYSKVIAFTTLIARRLILMMWKQEASPTHVQWTRDVMGFLQLEKMRCTIGGSTDRFYKTWQPFLTYMENVKMCTLP